MEFSDHRANQIEEGIDLSIRITERLEPNEIAGKLGVCWLLAVASPDYLAPHGVPIHPKALSQHLCLGSTQAGAHQSWSFLIDGRRKNFPIDSWLDANNGEVLTEAAAQGMGIAMQPDFIVAPFIEQGKVRQILEEFAVPEIGIYGVLPTLIGMLRLICVSMINKLGNLVISRPTSRRICDSARGSQCTCIDKARRLHYHSWRTPL